MKASITKIVLLFVAIVLATGIVLWTKYGYTNPEESEKLAMNEKAFSKEHLNYLKVDTFINLVNRAYHPNVKTIVIDSQVVVELKGANAIAKDFFNGNDDVLKYKMKDFGFEIVYDKNENNVFGNFKIDNNLVPIPNDVLIKLVDKTTH